MVDTGDTYDSGIEVVEQLEGGEGEEAYLLRLPKAIDPQIGETAGSDVRVLGLTHLIVVEVDAPVDDETAAMMQMQGQEAPDRIQQGIVAASNEAGEAGHAIVQVEGGTLEEMIAEAEALL